MRVIIVGGGKTVYFLAKQFAAKGYHTSIINRNEHDAQRLSRHLEATVIRGDGSEPAVLESAGARQTDVVLAMTPHDQDNLITCQLAQRMYGVPRTIALVNDPESEPIFRQLGVTIAFSATQIIATLIEEQADFDEVINLIPAAGGRVNVTEVTLPDDAPAVGMQLRELRIPQNALIATIIRDEEVIIPGGASRLETDDRLIIITQPETYADTIRALTGDEE